MMRIRGREPSDERCLRSFMIAARSLSARAKSISRVVRSSELVIVITSSFEPRSHDESLVEQRGTVLRGPIAVMVGETLKSMKLPAALT